MAEGLRFHGEKPEREREREAVWCFQLMLQAKAFIWRIMVWALHLGYMPYAKEEFIQSISFAHLKWIIVGIDF